MADQKKAATSLNGNLASPSLNKFRDAAIKKLRQVAASCDDSEDDGLDHLYATTEALINLNSEIAQRCLANYTGVIEQKNKIPDESLGGLYLVVNSSGGCSRRYTPVATPSSQKFFRFGFDNVKVQSTKLGDVEITTSPTRSENVFTLPSVPDVLGDIIPMTTERSSDTDLLPDYQQILGQASLLHTDVLILFLVILKDHLKSVQVVLGNVESWLLRPEHVIVFLNETFKPNPLLSIDPSTLEEETKTMCARCSPFRSALRTVRCPNCHQFTSPHDIQHVAAPQVLRSIPFSKGSMECIFQVTETSQQEMLTQLLSFLELSRE